MRGQYNRNIRVPTLVLVALAGCAASVSAQDARGEPFPITLAFDLDRSIDTGADLTFGAATAIAMLENRALSGVSVGPGIAIPLGIAKTVFLDHPLAVFLLVLQHEAFGHGGRARELGSQATFRMGSPWTFNALFEGGTRFGGGASFEPVDSPQKRRIVFLGGTESNARAATLVERELVAGRSAHPIQLLYFVRSRWYASQYVLRTPHPVRDPLGFFGESNGGDVATYLGELNREYFGETGIAPDGVADTVLDEYHRLRRQAWVNLADPATWLALWTLARQSVIGADAASIYAIEWGGRRFLPILSADWMVDGGALSLEAVFSAKRGALSGPRWFSFVARRGRGPAGGFWNAGGASEMVAAVKALRIGGELEVWNQPSSGFGAGASARVVVTRGPVRGLLVDVGAKSDGHWPGRPIDSGAFFRVGFRYVRTH
jgi:hypothetical protein